MRKRRSKSALPREQISEHLERLMLPASSHSAAVLIYDAPLLVICPFCQEQVRIEDIGVMYLRLSCGHAWFPPREGRDHPGWMCFLPKEKV